MFEIYKSNNAGISMETLGIGLDGLKLADLGTNMRDRDSWHQSNDE